jgi:hypothetical protein
MKDNRPGSATTAGTSGETVMHSRFGSTILIGLLYAQAAFGLIAVGAVVMKDHAADRALAAPTVEIASAASSVIR